MSYAWLVVCLLAMEPGLATGADGYVGAAVCASCHRGQYDRQVRSRHAQALHRIADSPIADALLKARPPGPGVHYERRGDSIAAAVEQGDTSRSVTLEWAFGAGAQGITPVGQADGRYIEHRFSYYKAVGGLARTFGHPPRADNAAALLGLPQSNHAIGSCFGCHATGVEVGSGTLDLSAMSPGIACERCHGPGRAHVEAARSGAPIAEIRKAVVNPARFPAKAEVEICGQCHRLPAPGELDPQPELADPVNVRVAPIGLMASRCFQASGRLRCTTCHDPHEDAQPRTAKLYTERCASCHNNAPRSGSHCRRSSGQDCLPCHMRQASLGPYLKFTDHRIRVY